MWNLVSICLEIVLILMQDRCMVWMHPMDPLGDMGRVESRFGLLGDSVSGGAR
jgi:hypothetical protein